MKKLLLPLLLLSSSLTFADNAENLYKVCAGCHGENGEKSALQKSVIIAGQESNLTIKELKAYKNGELDQYGLGGIMKMQLNLLSEEDIETLAEYIAQMENNNSK